MGHSKFDIKSIVFDEHSIVHANKHKQTKKIDDKQKCHLIQSKTYRFYLIQKKFENTISCHRNPY